MKRRITLGLLLLLTGCCSTGDPVKRARERLCREVETAEGFRQVRAAEALGPTADFPVDSPEPQTRIGQYRVRIAAGRHEYEKILRCKALDSSLPEQCHALESSAKLAVAFSSEEQKSLRKIVDDTDSSAAGYALWLLTANGDEEAGRRLTAELESGGTHQQTCAYACGFLPKLAPRREAALRRLMEREAADSLTGAFAAWALARHQRLPVEILLCRLKSLPAEVPEQVLRFHLEALGETGGKRETALLAGYLDDSRPEIANAAAGSILRIARRNGQPAAGKNRGK